ncbi:MAG TPA: aldehyde dehydrogenase family protein [Alphaproteobacteria bacterium]|nr:aldehyde dehydrogenase family protein [Alphaproteobacteria bacterium]
MTDFRHLEATPAAYVDGDFRNVDGEPIVVVNPSDEAVVARVPAAKPGDAAAAVAAARNAQPDWARIPAPVRADALRRIADGLEREGQLIAAALTAELGKPKRKALDDVANAAAYLRYMAEWDRRIEGEIVPSDVAGEAIHLMRVPVGVVAAITAWNYPIDLLMRKVGPALITGNTVVVKPTEIAPLTALAVARVVHEHAGLPAGVFNMVLGDGRLGSALVADPGIDLVTMTGHRDTGKRIMAAAAANLTRVSLELGGSAPALVLPDADLDRAVGAILFARFENAGQVCTCAERIIVHRDIYDEFLDRFVAAVERITVGPPEQDPGMGPLVSRPHLEKVRAAAALAERSGARRILGGDRPPGDRFDRGWWFAPTILAEMPRGGPLAGEEIFGPVAAVYVADSEDDMVSIANETRYGLSAFVFSESYRRVMRLTDRIACGELYVNRTMGEALQGFHGGHRESGMGGEDGKHGVLKYTQIRTVYHSYG